MDEKQSDSDRQTRDRETRGESGDACGSRHRRRRSHRHRSGERGGRSHRKERVLHTRISEQLSEDIRHLADDLRVPVSNLVRNVLEEVFTTVEAVSGDVGSFFDEVIDEAEAVRERMHARSHSRRRHRRFDPVDVEDELQRDEKAERAASGGAAAEDSADAFAQTFAETFAHVLAWQPVVLNQQADCASCSRSLEAGDHAFLASPSKPEAIEIACPDCIADRR